MKRLKKIYVEITNVCNLRCPFCPPHSRAPSFMAVTDFRALVTKIAGKADTLYFHVKGEPLLHPDLAVLIDIAGESGFAVHLTTNGTLLEKAALTLSGKKNLSRINVSLHSLPQLEPAGQERMTRAILRAAEDIVAVNRAINPRFLISLRLWTKDNLESTANSLRIIEEFFHCRKGTIGSTLAEKNGCPLKDGIAIHAAETFVWPSLSGTDFGRDGFCQALRDQAGILADGTVVPCCLDGDGIIALGNVFTDEWADIVGKGRASEIHDGFSNRKVVEPLCRRCGFRTRFGV